MSDDFDEEGRWRNPFTEGGVIGRSTRETIAHTFGYGSKDDNNSGTPTFSTPSSYKGFGTMNQDKTISDYQFQKNLKTYAYYGGIGLGVIVVLVFIYMIVKLILDRFKPQQPMYGYY